MRFSTVFAIVATTACAYVNAAPVVQSRQGNGDFGCPAVDDNNTQLELARNAAAGDSNDGGLVCRYTGSGTCRFFADGTFSSGGSGCPQGLVAGGTKSLADGGAAAGGGGAAAPSTTPAAAPPATSDSPVAAPPTSTSVVVVAPSSTSSSSAATVAPSTSARPIATSSSSSSSASSSSSSSASSSSTNAPQGNAQGNGASHIAQQRPMVLVTVLGIAAGAFMAL